MVVDIVVEVLYGEYGDFVLLVYVMVMLFVFDCVGVVYMI